MLQQQASTPDVAPDANAFAEVTEEEDAALMGKTFPHQVPPHMASEVSVSETPPSPSTLKSSADKAETASLPSENMSAASSAPQTATAASGAAQSSGAARSAAAAAPTRGAITDARSRQLPDLEHSHPQHDSPNGNRTSASGPNLDKEALTEAAATSRGPHEVDSGAGADVEDEAMWARWEQAEAEAEAAGVPSWEIIADDRHQSLFLVTIC